MERHNLAIPKDNIEVEDRYREILHDFIRPARSMFAGMFTEVRIFADTLSELAQTNLHFISGRYGLLHETQEIIPYSNHIQNEQDLEILDERTDFSRLMIDAAKNHEMVIILLPKHYIIYLLKRDWFNLIDKNSFIVVVSSKQLRSYFAEYTNVKVLPKNGIARIGRENRNEILDFVNSQSKIFNEPKEV
jgi:cytoplasmic iron level regulating protein YaaA (DUF328/UPF0246 family)